MLCIIPGLLRKDVTDPTETGPSYNLFTKDFFQQLQNLLAPGGVFVQQSGAVTPVKLKMFSFLNENLRAVFPNVQGYTAQIPTFVDPWGFLMVSSMGLRRQLSHQSIDQKLAQANVRGLRFIDGQTMQGIFCLPLYVRKAIEAEHGTPW